MSPAWIAGACIVGAASFVHGLAGFGIGLVSLALLPFFMSAAEAVVLMTIYAAVFSAVILWPLRRHLAVRDLRDLLVGTVIGTPLGVWVLAVLPASALARLIGLVLVVIVALEFLGRAPARLAGRGWALGAGVAAGVVGARWERRGRPSSSTPPPRTGTRARSRPTSRRSSS
ncbi:MAG: sulfite exporter TauE/SafE family protein [Candidatus Rokubacteria bacterium]|nr:sulfite exporter TauE/SafE family protein [Candidatus Rokubacteria bacterium]MBI3827678.1 sulfite exporter TauE/SafE family protein [Candidatus Rokubacteria bacterium]